MTDPTAPLPECPHDHATCDSCGEGLTGLPETRRVPTAPLPDEELTAIRSCIACAYSEGFDHLASQAEDEMTALLAALRAERAAPLDVERLARALDAFYGGMGGMDAPAIAVEYARLAPATDEGAET